MRRLFSALTSSRRLPCMGVGGRAAMLPRPPALVAARALLSSRTSGAEPPLAESFPVSAATAVEAVRAPPEAASRFAIIALGGAQYQVAPDDLIVVEKLALPEGADLVHVQRALDALNSHAEGRAQAEEKKRKLELERAARAREERSRKARDERPSEIISEIISEMDMAMMAQHEHRVRDEDEAMVCAGSD